jgi:hypothetical protein
VSVSGAKTLRALRAGRLRVRVTGLPAGAAVRLRALKGGKLVATGAARANTQGVASVTVKLTAAGKRALRGARTVTLRLVAGGGQTVLRLR